MKTGLVMEGGAMRGMFTCGVIDVLLSEGIEFDGGAGISAGAVFGCNVKSKQIGRALRYNKKYGSDPRYMSVRSFLKTGDLYGAEFCYHTLPDELDPFDRKTFRENPMEFYVGATDIKTGEIVYHLCTDGEALDIEWLRASASMPVVSQIVKVDGYELLDGGMVDAVPLGIMEEKGYDRNLVILTQPLSYRKSENKMVPLMKLMYRKYPKVTEVMKVRHERYNRQMDEIREKELSGEIFVIRPPESLHISRTENDPKELQRVYDIGRKEALKHMTKIREFLGK